MKRESSNEKLSMVFQNTILASQIEVQNQAFERIGNELYENVGQMLSVAQLNLCALEESKLSDEQLATVQQISAIIGHSITDIRMLIRNLESYLVKDFDLSSNLRLEIERIRKIQHRTIELNIKGNPYTLGYEKEVVLFRNIQKVLIETLKGISSLTVKMDYQNEDFSVEISTSDSFKIAPNAWKKLKQNFAVVGFNSTQIRTHSEIKITITSV